MSKGFEPLIKTFIFFSLFAISFITGAHLFAVYNEPSQDILADNTLGNFSANLQQNLSTNYNNIKSVEDAAGNSSVSVDTGSGIILESISGSWKTLKAYSVQSYDLTAGFLKATLFTNGLTIVLTVMATIIGLTFIFAFIRWLRTGEGGDN